MGWTHSTDFIRVAVVSDLHAYSALPKPPGFPPSDRGHYCIDQPQSDPQLHPFAGLRELIEKRGLSADLLVCLGDLTEKAEPAPIAQAWSQVHELGGWLGTHTVLGTVGNHDVDSRGLYNSVDPWATIKNLRPAFPTPKRELNNQYWARHYTIFSPKPNVRFVMLNSAAYQGATDEYKHGRVDPQTIHSIQADLEELGQAQLNVLLVHHHPHRFGDIDLTDYSEMLNGQVLLEGISKRNSGPWLVLHGHKHWPRLGYAAGGATSPVVMSAGSLSAEIYSELALKVRNQFYILTLPLDASERLGLTIAGEGMAWDWNSPGGWSRATKRSGLPAQFGFGNRTDPKIVARSLADAFRESNEPILRRSELTQAYPQLRYLLPRDERDVAKAIEDDGLAVRMKRSRLENIQLTPAEIKSRLTQKSDLEFENRAARD